MTRRRSYGTGQVYEKHGAYYGRWRTGGGRKLNRKIGLVRAVGASDGLTRSQAERRFRQLQEAEERRPSRTPGNEHHTIEDTAGSLYRQLAVDGARKAYLEGCESMLRVHIAPRLGSKPVSYTHLTLPTILLV